MNRAASPFATSGVVVRRWRIACKAAAALVCALLLIVPARAQIVVDGEPASVRLQVEQATAAEVLDALGAVFGLRYRASETLDQRVNGNFSGSLERVLGRVLNGYDYVVRRSPNGLDVVVYVRSVAAVPPNRRATNIVPTSKAIPIPPPAASSPWQSSNTRMRQQAPR